MLSRCRDDPKAVIFLDRLTIRKAGATQYSQSVLKVLIGTAVVPRDRGAAAVGLMRLASLFWRFGFA